MFAKLVLGNAALSYVENTGSGASVDATQPTLGGNLGVPTEQRIWNFPLDGLSMTPRLRSSARVGSSWSFCILLSF